MDYRRMYDDSEMLYAYDLEGAQGRDVVLVIESVYRGEVTGQKNKKSKKPFVKFVGKDKKLALNKTNGKAIAQLYGKDTERWPGQAIAIFATTTEFGGETVDCIRVRPYRPEMPNGNNRGGRNGNNRNQGSRSQQQAQPREGQPAPPTEQPVASAHSSDVPDVPDASSADDDLDVDAAAERDMETAS